MNDKKQREERARLVEFVQVYQSLNKWQRLGVNWQMVRMLAKGAAARRSLAEALTTIEFARRLMWDSLAPFVLAGVFTLAALGCWGWAMTTGAGVLWLACLALSVAAVLKVRPLIVVESDEVE